MWREDHMVQQSKSPSLEMLVKKANEDRVLEITDRLGDLLLNGNDQHRDFAGIALKTFVLEVTTMSVSQQILVSLIPQLLGRNKYYEMTHLKTILSLLSVFSGPHKHALSWRKLCRGSNHNINNMYSYSSNLIRGRYMEFMSLLALFFFLLSFLSLLFFLHSKHQSNHSIYTGLRTYPFVGTLPDFLKNRHRLLKWTTELVFKHPTNTVFVRGAGDLGVIITANPMNVEHIFKTNFENYPKGDWIIDVLHDFLGSGIFNSDGELWKVQRKTASFEFSKRSLRNFVMETVQQEIQNRLLPLLQIASETNKTVDLQDIFERFAFDNVCMIAFNHDPSCLVFDSSCNLSSSPFAFAFERAANLSAERFRYALPFLWKIKKLFNLGSETILRQSISTVHDFAMNIITSRKSSNKENMQDTDLLSRFIVSTNNDNSNKNSDEFLRDIIVSFILAGRDTTSSALAWFFWLLSSKPQVEQKIIRELKSIRTQFQKGPFEMFDYEEMREMQYLHAAVTEVLRLYPPVALDARVCMEDDVMPDGTVVKKGCFVTYNAYAMGRLVGIWGRDCSSFVPERWLDEKGMFRAESPYRFPAFHGGPRMCLGKEMAYIQMKSIVACVVERFEIDVLGKDKCPDHLLSLTMRMKGGLPVRVREKKINGQD